MKDIRNFCNKTLIRKMVSLLMVITLVVGLAACGSGGSGDSASDSGSGSSAEADGSSESAGSSAVKGAPEEAGEGNQIVLLVSAAGSLDDKSFNTACWVGMNRFCEEHPEYSATYFQPTEDTVEAQMAACDAAVAGGAQFVVAASDQFKVALLEMSQTYPDVTFLSIEANPQNLDGEVTIEDNVQVVNFKAEQSGFFAGYASVKEGYRKLGTIGGMAVPGVIQYMYGFVKGADAAAEEMGLDDVVVKYTYAGNFDPSPENQAMAAAWYEAGTEVIFAVAATMNSSIFAAAEENGNVVSIGCDSNQNEMSERVLTSALKDTENVTYNGLNDWIGGAFETGVAMELGSEDGACGIAMDGARFENFTEEDYKELYDKVAGNEGGITDSIPSDEDYDDPTQIPLSRATLDYIK